MDLKSRAADHSRAADRFELKTLTPHQAQWVRTDHAPQIHRDGALLTCSMKMECAEPVLHSPSPWSLRDEPEEKELP